MKESVSKTASHRGDLICFLNKNGLRDLVIPRVSVLEALMYANLLDSLNDFVHPLKTF